MLDRACCLGSPLGWCSPAQPIFGDVNYPEDGGVLRLRFDALAGSLRSSAGFAGLPGKEMKGT